mgnify:CR=1 FL=1
MYINTHQEDVFVAVSHSDRSKFAKFWTQMTNACKRLLNINISLPSPGGFLRKRPLQMYKKIRMEKVMWIRNFLNTGYFALFFSFAGRNALVLTSYKKEEDSFNFGHETGFKLQKPGHNTSAYIFSSCQGAFLFIRNLCSPYICCVGSQRRRVPKSRIVKRVGKL